MSWPTIQLDAINRQAAELFARKDLTDAPARSMVVSLEAKLTEVDSAISSIEGQLETRRDDPAWEASAKRAMDRYLQQKKSIMGLLKTARVLVSEIAAKQRQAAKHEHAKQNELMQEQQRIEANRRRQEQKMQRIAAANSEDREFLDTLKKVVRQELGHDRFMEMIEKTHQAIAAKKASCQKPKPEDTKP